MAFAFSPAVGRDGMVCLKTSNTALAIELSNATCWRLKIAVFRIRSARSILGEPTDSCLFDGQSLPQADTCGGRR